MAEGRARLAASILDADLGNLAHAVRRAERAGADRIHLDVMDGHFVPNITFGARTIKALREVTRLPFDAHLMISEPGRYLAGFLDAGCDSVTIHVEIEEQIEPTLRAIRAAGRAAGLAIKPATSLAALEPYRELLDIVMVMTVEPGFGGQSFMRDAARKALPARSIFPRPWIGEVHMDGGVNRETAEYAGGLGVDVLIVGSALFKPGHSMSREIRLIKRRADQGYATNLNEGRPPVSHDAWTVFVTLPRHLGDRLRRELERDGVPVIQLRGDGQVNPDGLLDDDLLVPAAEAPAIAERWGQARDAALADADAWRATFAGAAR